MDTFVRVEIKGSVDKNLAEHATDKTISRMRKLTKQFDCYSGEIEPSPETQKVLEESERLKKLTKGAFDVEFKNDGKINLGGIAKGFIVDEGIAILKEEGIKEALINAGGDMYCMGEYKVGIRDPEDRRKIIAAFSVRDRGVATSGTYERGGHIIDPRTGKVVLKPGKSVTVIAETCMKADGLATALYVLKPREGLSIVENLDGTECFIIDETGAIYVSSGLKDSLDRKTGEAQDFR